MTTEIKENLKGCFYVDWVFLYLFMSNILIEIRFGPMLTKEINYQSSKLKICEQFLNWKIIEIEWIKYQETFPKETKWRVYQEAWINEWIK